jgi:hypothetical protein
VRYIVVRRAAPDRDWFEVVDQQASGAGRVVAAHRRRDAAHRDADARNGGDDHSASRRVDVLEREAPHLLAPSKPLEAGSHDA